MKRLILFCFLVSHFLAVHALAQGVKSNSSENLFQLKKVTTDTTAAVASYVSLSFIKRSSLRAGLFGVPESFEKKDECTIESGVYYTAFFCKMETMLRRHLNFWIKLRAGNDDIYRQMISGK